MKNALELKRISLVCGLLTVLAAVLIMANCGSLILQNTNGSRAAAGSSEPYFTGDGGKGIRLAVLEPTGKEISANDQWMLSLVQGTITSDINRYSAITVIDRQNLEKILAEQAQSTSGNYSDDDYISIGRLTNARLILIGTITKTASAFMLELSVTDVETGERVASYAPNPVTPSALENLSAIKQATVDLLAQLGVTLTESGLRELTNPAQMAQVQSQTALARGITANRSGTIVEAMNYFSEAASFDPNLSEANQRLANLNKQIESGNIGENIRNAIERRNAWKKLLEDANEFYNNHPYFNIVYRTVPEQGEINWNDGTVDLRFEIWPDPTASINVAKNLVLAWRRAKIDDMDVDSLANNLLWTFQGTNGAYYTMVVEAELLNEDGRLLSAAKTSAGVIMWRSNLNYVMFGAGYGGSMKDWFLEFKNVDAARISDKLIIKFTSIGKGTDPYGNRIAKNAVANVRTIPTDKTIVVYLWRRR
jgi:hypothetical protein